MERQLDISEFFIQMLLLLLIFPCRVPLLRSTLNLSCELSVISSKIAASTLQKPCADMASVGDRIGDSCTYKVFPGCHSSPNFRHSQTTFYAGITLYCVIFTPIFHGETLGSYFGCRRSSPPVLALGASVCHFKLAFPLTVIMLLSMSIELHTQSLLICPSSVQTCILAESHREPLVIIVTGFCRPVAIPAADTALLEY